MRTLFVLFPIYGTLPTVLFARSLTHSFVVVVVGWMGCGNVEMWICGYVGIEIVIVLVNNHYKGPTIEDVR